MSNLDELEDDGQIEGDANVQPGPTTGSEKTNDGRRAGRATTYAGAADCTRAREFSLLGYTDAEIAVAMGVSASTLYNWKRKYPAFAAAIADGGLRPNIKVMQALYKRAIGEIVTETREVMLRDADGLERLVVLNRQRYIPPDIRAIIFWLTNRQPEHWKIYKSADHPSDAAPVEPAHEPTSSEIIEAMERLASML